MVYGFLTYYVSLWNQVSFKSIVFLKQIPNKLAYLPSPPFNNYTSKSSCFLIWINFTLCLSLFPISQVSSYQIVHQSIPTVVKSYYPFPNVCSILSVISLK